MDGSNHPKKNPIRWFTRNDYTHVTITQDDIRVALDAATDDGKSTSGRGPTSNRLQWQNIAWRHSRGYRSRATSQGRHIKHR